MVISEVSSWCNCCDEGATALSFNRIVGSFTFVLVELLTAKGQLIRLLACIDWPFLSNRPHGDRHFTKPDLKKFCFGAIASNPAASTGEKTSESVQIEISLVLCSLRSPLGL